MADRAPRILLVDDEQPIQTLLSFPLQRDGYEVVQAADGAEALARFDEQIFDLVVLDVMLPRMDGFEVCRRLRERPTLNHVRIVAMTGFPSAENVERIMSAGADACLPKPLDPERLLVELGLAGGESTGVDQPEKA